MFIFQEKNNAGLSSVLFHPHFPLRTSKVTDIPLKINCCKAKRKEMLNVIFAAQKKKEYSRRKLQYVCGF